jgi:hypothetical protein
MDLIYRMLNKDPYARITTVRRVGLEIEELLGTKSPVARADSDGTAVQVSRFGSASTNRIIFTRHNLPAETMPFVGRVGELEQLRQLFDLPKTRLITLMGAGGIGKTSLALKFALQAGFPSMMAAALPVAATWLNDPVLLAQVSAIDAPAMRWAQGWSPYQTAMQTGDAPLLLSTDLHTFSQTVLDKLQQVTPV